MRQFFYSFCLRFHNNLASVAFLTWKNISKEDLLLLLSFELIPPSRSHNRFLPVSLLVFCDFSDMQRVILRPRVEGTGSLNDSKKVALLYFIVFQDFHGADPPTPLPLSKAKAERDQLNE